MCKLGIFVDLGYLMKITDSRLDFRKFINTITNKFPKQELFRAFFYDCLPYDERSSNSAILIERKLRFIDAIKKIPKTEIRLGQIQYNGGEYQQKQVDISLAVDALKFSLLNKISDVVLVTGDSDFVPLVRELKEFGTNVHIYGGLRCHSDLWKLGDTCYQFDKCFFDEIALQNIPISFA